MGNKVFKSLIDEKIEIFKHAFQKTSSVAFYNDDDKKLIHPGEYGTYRESICKDFLKLFIPLRLDIGNGFLINSFEEISTQCDIVIYDKNNTPLIENSERQRFFPVETICAIGEIKSDLSKVQFKKALNKLARNKQLRDKIHDAVAIKKEHMSQFEPQKNCYDSVFSFLICNKLNFKLDELTNEIDSFYDSDIDSCHKHNLILSIEDGLLTYYVSGNKTFPYPSLMNTVHKNRFIKPLTNKNSHFYIASSYMFMGTSSNSVYFPDMVNYMSGYMGGRTIVDQT